MLVADVLDAGCCAALASSARLFGVSTACSSFSLHATRHAFFAFSGSDGQHSVMDALNADNGVRFIALACATLIGASGCCK